MSGPRDSYRDVGVAMRALIERASAARLTTKEHRTLLAVIARTATYSRLEDPVTHSVLVKLSGLDRRDLSKALKRLAALGIIRYVAGCGQRYSIVGIVADGAGSSSVDAAQVGNAASVTLSKRAEGAIARVETGESALAATWARAPGTNEKDYEKDYREGPNRASPVSAPVGAEEVFSTIKSTSPVTPRGITDAEEAELERTADELLATLASTAAQAGQTNLTQVGTR